MSLDTIVKINITRQTKSAAQTGFGIGAFVSEGAVFSGFIKRYGDIDEVQADYDLAYLDDAALVAATRYFSQDLAPEALYIIKKGQDLPHIQLITFDAPFVAANSIAYKIGGVAQAAIPFNTDSDTTLQDFATALAGHASITTAVVNLVNRSILVTGATVNTLVSITDILVTGGVSQPVATLLLVQAPDETKTYVESIARAQDVDDTWYGLAIEAKDAVNQEAVADYIEPRVKAFFLSTADTNAKSAVATSDIGYKLKVKAYDRSASLYSGDAVNHPEMGLMGGQFPKTPGSSTYAYKEIKGAIPDKLLNGEETALAGKNYNYYNTVAALNVVNEGKVASGEYIDVIVGIDWVTARMKETTFTAIANAEKIPFTDAGFSIIENGMRAVLQNAVVAQLLNADFTVIMPKAASISIADKKARKLTGVKFFGTLQGAVHKAEINGTITL